MFVAILTFCGTMTVAAQDEELVQAYFTTADMPDMLRFLPAPPDTIGALFTHDIMQYMWGKTMRLDPERSAIAIRDAEYGLECIIREFSEPFGMQISFGETPEIYRVLSLAAFGNQSRPCRYHHGPRLYVRRESCHRGCPLAKRCGCRTPGRVGCLCQAAHQRGVSGTDEEGTC